MSSDFLASCLAGHQNWHHYHCLLQGNKRSSDTFSVIFVPIFAKQTTLFKMADEILRYITTKYRGISITNPRVFSSNHKPTFYPAQWLAKATWHHTQMTPTSFLLNFLSYRIRCVVKQLTSWWRANSFSLHWKQDIKMNYNFRETCFITK